MIKVFAKDGYLVVGTEGIHPVSMLDFEITNDLLTIYSPYVERNGTPYRVLSNVPVSRIEDEIGNAFNGTSLGVYLTSVWASKVQAVLSQADKDEIVAETVSQVNANQSVNDLGNLVNDPANPADGQFWYNETDGRTKIKTATGISPIEQGEDEWLTIEW